MDMPIGLANIILKANEYYSPNPQVEQRIMGKREKKKEKQIFIMIIFTNY